MSSFTQHCKSRQADLSDFFRHENHDYPPALADYGKIRKPHFELQLSKKVKIISGKVQHTDIVFDVYQNKPRKRETGEKHGKGKVVRISIKDNALIFKKNDEVMTVDDI